MKRGAELKKLVTWGRCRRCGTANSEFDPRCMACGGPLTGPSPDRTDALEPGEAVGRFRIVTSLGQGGMGTVYKASDLSLGRDVVLKFPRVSGNRERRRFEREARAAAALDHPNLGTVYDVGTHRGRPFLVLAYYDGETLAERLQRGPLPWRLAVTIARQLLGGLGAVHEAGFVHRDVKPANVLLPASGGTKLLDFGLAWHPELSRLTAEGLAVGTLAYVAPEQLRGERVDARSDLWSLGVILHEMLTGSLPFTDAPGGALPRLDGDLREGTVPGLGEGHFPASVARVVKRCLERAPARRPASAVAVRAELEEAEVEGDPASEAIRHRLHELRLQAKPLPLNRLLDELAELQCRVPRLPQAQLLEAELQRRLREARRDLAGDLLRHGAPEAAVELLRELAIEDPEDVETLVDLGAALAFLDRLDESVAALRRARELAPASLTAAVGLAEALELSGQASEARTLYVELMEGTVDGRSWKELVAVAQAAAHLGCRVTAVELLRAALKIGPANTELAFRAALVYCLVGDLSSARVYVMEALQGGFAPRWFQFPWFETLQP